MEQQVNPTVGESAPLIREERIALAVVWSLSLVWTPLLLLALWLSGVWP